MRRSVQTSAKVLLPLVLACAATATISPHTTPVAYAQSGVADTTAEQPVTDGVAKLFYADGRPKAQVVYKNGLLEGRYVAYAENGKVIAEARFKAGKLHGKLTQWRDDGKRLEIARYKDGLLEGTRTIFVDGSPKLYENYKAGEKVGSRGDETASVAPIAFLFENNAKRAQAPTATDDNAKADEPADSAPDALSLSTPKPNGYPLSLKELSRAMDKIASAKIEGAQTDAHADATRRTILHRLVGGVPKFMLKHDPEDAELARLGSKMCHKLGRLDHTPDNPGLPEDEYKKAYEGTSKSNLHRGGFSTLGAIDDWMRDYGANNRDEIGHRRWMLSPGLFEVGYGRHEDFHALLVASNDNSDSNFDLITYPGRGYVPTEIYANGYSRNSVLIWSIHPGPRLYKLPDSANGIEATVHKINRDGTKEPITVQRTHITSKTGVPVPALLIEPVIGAIEHDARYEVEIKGLQPASRRINPVLKYFVHFVDMDKVK